MSIVQAPSEAEEPADDPPQGFKVREGGSLFSRRQGPFYYRTDGDKFFSGVRVKPKHCNSRKIMHGGMVSTLADNTMAGAVYRQLGKRALTVQMNVQFLSPARSGDWLEAVGEVNRMTKGLVFCEAKLCCGSRLVAHASGIFKRPKEI